MAKTSCMFCGEVGHHRITVKDNGEHGICSECEIFRNDIRKYRKIGFPMISSYLTAVWQAHYKRKRGE